jgi:hypothetical protein
MRLPAKTCVCAAKHHDQVRVMHSERSRDAGHDLGATIQYLRRKSNGAAGNGLGTSIKYL